jgi:ferrochelatase
LLYYSELQLALIKEQLGDDYQVELAMRYQQPSILAALERMKAGLVESIQVIPLFPQYASASTGSVIQKVMEIVGKWATVPPIEFVNSFHDNELIIEAFADNAKKYNPQGYDQVLFSFHGLPERQLIKCDHSGKHCLKTKDCCSNLTDVNKFCYSAQCHDTARLIAAKLEIPADKYSVCFQSRLGKEPWVQPYTSDTLKDLAAKGKKRLLVFCPAFVADCLETLYEVTVEYGEAFKAMGGEEVQLVSSLNDNPKFIQAIVEMVKS